MNCFKKQSKKLPQHELDARYIMAHLQNKQIMNNAEEGSLVRLKFIDDKYAYITSYETRILTQNEISALNLSKTQETQET